MAPENFQNGAANLTKLSQIGTKRKPGWPTNQKNTQIQQKGGSICQEHRFGDQEASNMTPRWLQTSIPNRQQIEANIDQNNDAVQERSLMRCCWILGVRENGGKLAPKSMPLAKTIFCKKTKKQNRTTFLMVLGIEVWIRNRSQIDRQNEINVGRHLGIDFRWI